MKTGALNADLEAARLAVEAHMPELERIYTRLIEQAAAEAATALVASAETTAMVAATNDTAGTPDWQIPPEGLLFAMSVIAQRATKRLARLHRRIVKQIAAPPLARVGIGWTVTHPLSQALLESAGQRTGERLGLGVQDVLRETVASAYADGLPVRDTAALIRTKFEEAAPGQASMLARTDLNALSNGGSVMAAQMIGVTYKTWLTAEDDKVRETHADADGQTVPIDQPFDVGGESLEYPGDPGGSDAEVCNCFPASVVVEMPNLRAAMKRWYEGDLVTVRTATGYELSGTPNHPVLRADGKWIALGEIEEGDDLVRASSFRHDLGTPHENRPPSEIGEVYRLARGSAEAHRKRLRPVDFHGDGGDGEVDVVSVDGSLFVNRDAASDEQIAKFGLALATSARSAFRGRLKALHRVAATTAWLSPSSARSVRGESQIAPFFDRHSGEAQYVRLASASDRQPEFAQTIDDDGPADVQSLRHAQDAFPALVSVAKVVQIDRAPFHGFVFNIDTGAGYYSANGFACLNCRCSVIYGDSLGETASARPSGRVPSRGMAVALPAEMTAPRPRMPGKGFAAAAPEPALAAPAWVSDLAFEGTATSDGRYILPNALGWRELPLSLGAMFDTPHADIVTASPVIGRIDSIEKADDDMDGEALASGVRAIRGHGMFDLAGADGANVARLVADETLRGVSIDLAVDEWCFRDPETGDLIDPDEASDAEMERAMFGELQYAVIAGTIMAATVCPAPAFADARIALTASVDGRRVMRLWAPLRIAGEALTASAAGLAPAKPPADWFTRPEAKSPTPLTVTAAGQVYGHMALWDSCHTGYPGQCIPPPRSQSGYAYFNLGEVECADGSRVACGAITLEALHADTDRPLSPNAVRAHYEHTGVVGAYVRATDGVHGIWVAGALRANLSERHARDLMGAKPSGDWRQTRPGGPLEMLGVHAVNEPGYPVPRLVASALLPSGGRAVLEFAEPEGGRVPSRGFARVA